MTGRKVGGCSEAGGGCSSNSTARQQQHRAAATAPRSSNSTAQQQQHRAAATAPRSDSTVPANRAAPQHRIRLKLALRAPLPPVANTGGSGPNSTAFASPTSTTSAQSQRESGYSRGRGAVNSGPEFGLVLLCSLGGIFSPGARFWTVSYTPDSQCPGYVVLRQPPPPL